jgi:hypothetical protein
LPPVVICSGFEPSCATIQSSSSPVWSEMNATFEPSGDQRGHFSCAPDVLVRLRVGPLLDRRGEDVAARAEQHALALRTERRRLRSVRRADAARAGGQAVVGT